jgi:hypothetical protein
MATDPMVVSVDRARQSERSTSMIEIAVEITDGHESLRRGTREARREWRCLSLSGRGR